MATCAAALFVNCALCDIHLGPTCVIGNNAFAVKRSITKTVYDYGGKHEYTIPRLANYDTAQAVWTDILVVAWYTCEGNAYHMMHETLDPISHVLDKYKIDDVHVAIVQNGWPPVSTNGCHSMNFKPLFGALGVSILFNLGRDVMTFDKTVKVPKAVCYKRTVQVSPEARGSLPHKLLSWAVPPSCNNTASHVVIVQRRSRRRIGNAGRLLEIAFEYTQNARIVELEEMSVSDQIKTLACGRPIVAAVQGAGLAWTQLLKSTSRLSVVIEWTWQNWGSKYVKRSKSSNVLAIESRIPANQTWCPFSYANNCCDGDCRYATKHFDVNVGEETWRRDLARAMAHTKDI